MAVATFLVVAVSARQTTLTNELVAKAQRQAVAAQRNANSAHIQAETMMASLKSAWQLVEKAQGQVDAIRESNRLTAQALISNQRARLLATKAQYDDISGIIGKDDPAIAQNHKRYIALEFTNMGSLPALGFNVITCSIFESGTTAAPACTAYYPNTLGVIAPGKTTYVVFGPKELTPDLKAGMRLDARLSNDPHYLRGTIGYFDGFSILYEEPFCTRVRMHDNEEVPFFDFCVPGEAGMPVPVIPSGRLPPG